MVFTVSDFNVLEGISAGNKLIEEQGRDIVIPSRFTKIRSPFERDSIDSIVIHDEVTEIGDYAFHQES